MDFIKNLAVNWTAGNPVLPDEVFGIETDTNRVKLGDGTTRWNSLGYFGEGSTTTWGSISGTLALQTDLNAILSPLTIPSIGTLTTGSNAINLTNAYGQEYSPYDMASGALTLTVGASPIRGGNAYGIIIADGATTPTVSAFTLLSVTYTNTDNVQNHFLISYKYNGSGALTAYLQWIQPA
jgi:hypothetical protein